MSYGLSTSAENSLKVVIENTHATETYIIRKIKKIIKIIYA